MIQDVDIPIARAAEFLDFFRARSRIWPHVDLPDRPGPNAGRFALYPLRPGGYVNFGFWDVMRTREAHPPGISTA